MDEYSQKTIQLLLDSDKPYLKQLLNDLSIETDDLSDSKEIGQLLENQKDITSKMHKSSIFTCRCGSSHVITREMQLRSSDEGSTIIHLCLECGNKW